MTDTPTPPTDKPNPHFRNRRAGPKLTRDEAQRQGDITNLAFKLLGGREPAIGFLNDFHPELDGVPLMVAVASSEGYELVQAAIHRRTANSQ